MKSSHFVPYSKFHNKRVIKRVKNKFFKRYYHSLRYKKIKKDAFSFFFAEVKKIRWPNEAKCFFFLRSWTAHAWKRTFSRLNWDTRRPMSVLGCRCGHINVPKYPKMFSRRSKMSRKTFIPHQINRKGLIMKLKYDSLRIKRLYTLSLFFFFIKIFFFLSLCFVVFFKAFALSIIYLSTLSKKHYY